MLQSEALTILKTGANVFLTGEPGSGKSHTINTYVAYLRERGVEPAITASTGIAATHVGGLTIHSWSGIGIKSELSRYDLDSILTSEYITKRVNQARVLIIDEVSMLGPDTLSMVERVCREIRGNTEPFGGMQVILVGDFFQLPPIVRAEESDEQQRLLPKSTARFAYDSPVWQSLSPIVCYLTEQHRQDDAVFLDLLSAIRGGNVAEKHIKHLEKRKKGAGAAPADAPKLFTHNINVDRVNDDMLEKLPGRSHRFDMRCSGSPGFVAALKRGCLSPETLLLKKGAAVMFTKNNPKEGYVNGTLGVVEEFDSLSGMPIVYTRDKKWITVYEAKWSVEENGRPRASIEQLPLRLAWAITVHKSQGMSMDEAVVDLSQVFEYGQGYVALSRVRRLAGLYVLGWNDKSLLVHPDILQKDADFRASSDAAAETFGKLSEDECHEMQRNFIRACGGIFAEDAREKPAAPSGNVHYSSHRRRPRKTRTRHTTLSS